VEGTDVSYPGEQHTKEIRQLTVEESATNLKQLVSPSADRRMDCFLPIR
jgi:hypothetical protein